MPEPSPDESSLKPHDKPHNLSLGHVAIAVPDLQNAIERWKSVLKLNPSSQQNMPEHGVRVVFFDLENTRIELLEPLGENSPLKAFLEKNPRGAIHHICFEAQNLDSLHARLLEQQTPFASRGKAIGAHGNPVFFLHPKALDGVLVEFEGVAGSGRMGKNHESRRESRRASRRESRWLK